MTTHIVPSTLDASFRQPRNALLQRLRRSLVDMPTGWERNEVMRHGYVLGALGLDEYHLVGFGASHVEPEHPDFRYGFACGDRARKISVAHQHAVPRRTLLPDVTIRIPIHRNRWRGRRLTAALASETNAEAARLISSWLRQPQYLP